MDEFRKELAKLVQMVKDLQAASYRLVKVVFPNDRGTLRVPKYDGDPASPTDGEIWYDYTNHKFRKHVNGVSSDLS